MSKAIGTRWECRCCDRVARIIANWKGGYIYKFESELEQRWISERDASIRFHRIGDDMETVKRKLEVMK